MRTFFSGALSAIACLALASCPSMGTAPGSVNDYLTSVTYTIEGLAGVAIQEGDLQPSTALAMAGALEALATGSIVPIAGEVAAALNLGGYPGMVVSVAVWAIDTQLRTWGVGGPEWNQALMKIAQALRNATDGIELITNPSEVRAFGTGPGWSRTEPFTVELEIPE